MVLAAISSHSQAQPCNVGRSFVEIEAENLRARLMNQGDMFWNAVASPKFEWPKGSGKHLCFASCFWFGGKDSATGKLITAVQTYRGAGAIRNFWPGPIVTSQQPVIEYPVCSYWDQHFVLDRASFLSHMEALEVNALPLQDDQIPEQVRRWPAKGNSYLKAEAMLLGVGNNASFDEDLAPFVDANGNGIYDPKNGDYPDMGNRLSMVWWVMNDAGNKKNYEDNRLEIPSANLEFQVLAYTFPSFNGQHYLSNSLFMNWKVINKGNRILENCYNGLFTDPDIGIYKDDFVQCHPVKNLALAYNRDNVDSTVNILYGYGENPPALAFKILRSPGPVSDQDGIDNNRNGQVDEPGEERIMTGLIVIPNHPEAPNGDPVLTFSYYRRLLGRFSDSTQITYGGMGTNQNSTPTTFMFPGNNDPLGIAMGGTVQNPVQKSPWYDSVTGSTYDDRRMLLCSGPFRFQPGQAYTYSFCNLVGFGGNNLENRDKLYSISDSLEAYLPLLSQRPAVNPTKEEEVHVYPNPSRGEVNIHAGSAISSVIVTDMRGKQMAVQERGMKLMRLDCSTLQKGIYFISVLTKKGREMKKLILL